MSNLPDGCSENDLPGNSQKDVFIEEWLDGHFEDAEYLAGWTYDEEELEKISPPVRVIMANALGKKYIDWLTDKAIAAYYEDAP